MEIPGWMMGANLGLVNQSTLAAAGATVSFKMSRMNLRDSVDRVSTGHNMNFGFKSAIGGLRGDTMTLHQASYDPVPTAPNLLDLPFAIFANLFMRAAFTPFASAGAGTGVVLVTDPVYLMPGILVMSSTWAPDAEAGQPFDVEAETVLPYSSPGETAVAFTF